MPLERLLRETHPPAKYHLRFLVGKSKLDSERWVHISRRALLLVNLVQRFDFRGVELDDLHVFFDSR